MQRQNRRALSARDSGCRIAVTVVGRFSLGGVQRLGGRCTELRRGPVAERQAAKRVRTRSLVVSCLVPGRGVLHGSRIGPFREEIGCGPNGGKSFALSKTERHLAVRVAQPSRKLGPISSSFRREERPTPPAAHDARFSRCRWLQAAEKSGEHGAGSREPERSGEQKAGSRERGARCQRGAGSMVQGARKRYPGTRGKSCFRPLAPSSLHPAPSGREERGAGSQR